MKKLILILSIAAFAFCASAQSIQDNVDFINFCYADGDTVAISKSPSMKIEQQGNDVLLWGAEGYNREYLKIATIDATEMGYSHAYELRRELAVIINKVYYETYSYASGTTHLDTVKYWYIYNGDTTLKSYVSYGWSGDSLISKDPYIW